MIADATAARDHPARQLGARNQRHSDHSSGKPARRSPKFNVFLRNSRYSGLRFQGWEQAIASERISGLGALNGSAFSH